MGHVACTAEIRKAYKIWAKNPEDHLRDPVINRKFTFDIDLRETGCQSDERIHLAQDGIDWQALVNTVMNLISFHKRQQIS